MTAKPTFRRLTRRCCVIAAIAAASSLAAAATETATQNGGSSPTASARPLVDENPDGPQGSKREGTEVDTVGTFRVAGDRATFCVKDGSAKYQGLENLALERVTNVLANSRAKDVEWSVKGTLTEFRGRNYLLIDRAVVKASGPVTKGKRTRRASTGDKEQRPSNSP